MGRRGASGDDGAARRVCRGAEGTEAGGSLGRMERMMRGKLDNDT